MKPAILALAAVAMGASIPPASGEPLGTDTSPCGGDAYSSAQVVEGRAPRRGPIVAMPDTLCADLAPQQPPVPVEIYVDPYGGGYPGGAAPYGGQMPRGIRPDGRPPRNGG